MRAVRKISVGRVGRWARIKKRFWDQLERSIARCRAAERDVWEIVRGVSE